MNYINGDPCGTPDKPANRSTLVIFLCDERFNETSKYKWVGLKKIVLSGDGIQTL